MSRRRRGVMSESFKYELAKELGFYNTVQEEGWGGIKAKDAGNMVKRAIEIAEQTLAKQQGSMPAQQYVQSSYPNTYGQGQGFTTGAYSGQPPQSSGQASFQGSNNGASYAQAPGSVPYGNMGSRYQ